MVVSWPCPSPSTLTSQGRSVGVCVVGALQDPRKDVISPRATSSPDTVMGRPPAWHAPSRRSPGRTAGPPLLRPVPGSGWAGLASRASAQWPLSGWQGYKRCSRCGSPGSSQCRCGTGGDGGSTGAGGRPRAARAALCKTGEPKPIRKHLAQKWHAVGVRCRENRPPVRRCFR